MRRTPNRQQTILDKWRQTGFILANKLDEKEEKIFAQLNNIRNENNQKAKEIKSKEKEILEEKQNIANLTIQLKSIESENSVSQKHLFDFQAKDQHLEGVYNEILNVSLIHLKSFENLKNEKYLLNDSYFPMDKINSLSNKIKSFKIPKSVLQYTSEEKKLNKIRSFYTQKQKEFEEHEAAESIYQKMIDANQTLHQLHLQYKAVEEANESDRKERQREDELKRTYKELQENGKKKIQEEEKKLKNSFEELLGVRNTMSQKINSLQIQLEKLSNLVQITEEANQQKINEYVQKIQNQNAEIEELEHQVQELENSLRFDVETNTEPEKPKFPSMNMPQFPSFQIQQNRQQNNIANNQNNSTAQQPPVDQYKSSLHELLQRANQVYNGNFK